MILSEQIRKYRTELGISQEQLADFVYVTRQTVSNWESGKSTPDIHSLLMMCTLFHVSLNQLIFGKEIDDDIKYMMHIAARELSRVNEDDQNVQVLVTLTEGGKTRYRGVLLSYRNSSYEADYDMEHVFIDGFADGEVVKKIVCVWKTKGRGMSLDIPSHSFRTKLCERDERNRDAEIALWKGNGSIDMVKVSMTVQTDNVYKEKVSTNQTTEGGRIFMFENSDFIAAHKFCLNNKISLQKDKVCGCFYCLNIFSPDKIERYIKDEIGTAMCPYCGIDSVIGESSGYPITDEFLRQMKEYWFDGC